VNLSGPAGVADSAVVVLTPTGAINSTAGYTQVGSYQLTAGSGSTASFTGKNFTGITVIGALTVNQKALNPVANSAAKTKEYDGSAAMSGLSMNLATAGVLGADKVTLGSDGGFFSDKTLVATTPLRWQRTRPTQFRA